MRHELKMRKVTFRMYPVYGRTFNMLVTHSDLQGNVYWLATIIIFEQAFQIWVDLNTDGKMTFPKFDWQLIKTPIRKNP